MKLTLLVGLLLGTVSLCHAGDFEYHDYISEQHSEFWDKYTQPPVQVEIVNDDRHYENPEDTLNRGLEENRERMDARDQEDQFAPRKTWELR